MAASPSFLTTGHFIAQFCADLIPTPKNRESIIFRDFRQNNQFNCRIWITFFSKELILSQ